MTPDDQAIAERIGGAIRSVPDLKSDPVKLTDFLIHRFGLLKRDAVQISLRLTNEPRWKSFPPIEKMELILTHQCNLRCDYCFVGEQPETVMSGESGKRAIDFLIESSGELESLYVTFFGGEPLMAFGLMKEIVSYGERLTQGGKKKIHWRMTTNGTLFSKRILKFLKEHEVIYLLSIDGGRKTQDRHRVTKSGKGSFDFLARKFEMMKTYQPWMGVRLTVMPDTVNYLYENVKFLVEKGMNLFIIEPAEGVSWPEKSRVSFVRQMTDVAGFYLRRKREFNLKFKFLDKVLNDDEKLKPYNRGCWAGKSSIAVAPDGTIYPCSKFISHDSPYPPFILGDVERGITENENRRQLIQFPLKPECYECNLVFECSGGCPARNYLAGGRQSYTCYEECERARMKGEASETIQGFIRRERDLSCSPI